MNVNDFLKNKKVTTISLLAYVESGGGKWLLLVLVRHKEDEKTKNMLGE